MSFDTTWETQFYGQGRHLNRYPFDVVVSFVYRFFPREKSRQDIHILEVGCGAGNNLWFVAREGFAATGIDGSVSAIRYAKERFAAEGLEAALQVGDFTALPYPDNRFDLVVDRESLACCDLAGARRAVSEVWRVLRPGGVFFHNGYASDHFSATQGERDPDGLVRGIRGGTLAGIGQLRFYSEDEVRDLFASGWTLESLEHFALEDRLGLTGDHCEWRAVVKKSRA